MRETAKRTEGKGGGEGLMRMRQLAERSGLPVSTIKFYMSRGLLPEPRKIKPNVAYYDEEFLRRLLIVKTMRDEGLSISSIKSILDRYSFKGLSEWERFKREARGKEAHEREEEENLVAMSDEERRASSILDAAFNVFSQKGYHNATVDDIAREAEVSKGTCYQYFSGKEEIFIATMERTLKTLLAEAEAAGAQARDALTRLGLKGLTFISKYRDLQFMFVGIVSEVLGGNDKLRRKADEIFNRVADFLAEDIRAGIKEGLFREVDPKTVSFALIGIAEIVGNLYLIEEEFDVLQFFVSLMDFMQHGLAGPA
jgi:AcrR family transcriptional regulator/predicted DNA-binding transcriptional regulator AlpA